MDFASTLPTPGRLQVSTTCVRRLLHIVESELPQERLQRGLDSAVRSKGETKLVQRKVFRHVCIITSKLKIVYEL